MNSIVIKIFVVGPLSNNVILVADSTVKKAVVIDPSSGSFSLVLDYAKQNEFQIEGIWLTHSHFDHIGDVALLQKETKAKVFVHQADNGNLRNPGMDGLMIEEMEPVHDAILIEDSQKLSVGNLSCEVIATPGHTLGSVCFFFPDQHLLISGDTLFQGTMGRVNFSNSDPSKMWESLKKLATLPEDTKVIPGHGPSTIIGKEKSWMIDAKKRFMP
ncbi:MAG TPA: MBL fold metallo-hydrolase [Chlamydiales bacterium]|nr:MBL fold metallo-hydrolase [Chlamydiales bacterium]